jgi:VIT1/CCC1 family predicted Fe2+/Mn2+ transporter
VQAALASAGTFAVGAGLPLLMAAAAPTGRMILAVAAASLACLGLLGGVAARVGGAPALTGAVRVVFWGALAMGLTAVVGALFGTVAA